MAGNVIPLQEPFANIKGQFYSTLKQVLQNKFGCQPIFEGVDFKEYSITAQATNPSVIREKRFTGVLPGGVLLSVWKDDLINVRVDAVVNAANTQLEHHGGLAQSLCLAGGPKIQFESRYFIKRNGELNTGDAVEGTAGHLPCKALIHAVGPCLSPYPTSTEVALAEPLLKKAIKNVLKIVVKQQFKTVAIPALSSGIFNFPRDRCADIIVSTVKHFCQNPRGIEEILLVNNDEPTVWEMERACRQLLTSNQPLTYNQPFTSNQPFPSNQPLTYSQAVADKNVSPSLQLGSVLMTLKWGKIEEQKVQFLRGSLISVKSFVLCSRSNLKCIFLLTG